MNRRYYSKRHFERLSNGAPDSPALAAERIANRKAGEMAHADMLTKFGTLTAENAQQAIAYQAERIEHHKAALLKGSR